MKKILLTAVLAATGLFVQANTATPTVSSTMLSHKIEHIELQDNMVTSPKPLSNQEMAARKLIYLGLYDVYKNGHYIGRFHVYQIVN